MIKILLVDDEPDLLEVGKLFLEKDTDFIIDTCLGAEEAFSKLGEEEYAVVVSDYQMPKIDGIKFLRCIREREMSLPFILFTGKGREDVAVEAIKNGADFYLMKGGDARTQFTELSNMIKKCVEKRNVEVELQKNSRKFQVLLENLSDMITLLDAEGNILFTSSSVERNLGYSSKAAIGRNIMEILDPEDVEPLIESALQLDEMGSMTIFDVPVIHLDGSKRVHEAIITRSPEEIGEGFIINSRDVTDRRRVERENEESESLYKTIFETTGTATVIIEDNDVISMVNNEFERVSGLSREDVIGKSWTEIVADEDSALMRELFEGFLLSGEDPTAPIEFQVALKDGETRWLRATISTIPGRDSIVVSILDLTSYKRVEENLVRSEQLHRTMVENLWEGLGIIDSEGRFSFSNEAADEIFGVLPDGLIGRSISEFMDEESVMGSLTVLEASQILDLDIVRPDGMRRTVQSKALRVSEDSENPSEILLEFLDVTEHKMDREMKDRLLNAVNGFRDSIVLTDLDGTIVDVNPAALELFSLKDKKDMIGTKALDLISPGDRESIASHMNEVYTTGRTTNLECSLLTRSSTPTLVETHISIFNDSDGNPAGHVAEVRNIDDRKRAERELREKKEQLKFLNKKLNLLGSITRHDIQNQMMILMTYLNLLEDVEDRETSLRYRKKMIEAGKNILSELDFQRDYEEMGKKDPEWVNILEAVRRSQRALNFKDIDLKIETDGLALLADPLIEKVFYNLLHNSIQHAGNLTEISVYYQESDDGILLFFEDDGKGVSVEDKELIFEHGFGNGSGNGLYLAKEILGISGMMISETGIPNLGAKFEIMIPQGRFRTKCT